MTIATARPASTVVVVRDRTEGGPLEVLLVRRNDRIAFMGGAFVFPGGRLDEADYARARETASTDAVSRFPDLTPAEELPYRVAAVREMQEEVALTLPVDELLPIAHWVTPAVEPKRYDTRFFLARVPPGQTARHDAGETTELVWLPPNDALARCRAGDIRLPPPTWTTIRRLARFQSVEEAVAWARATKIVRVEPAFVQEGARRMLTLPGDPLHPVPPAWEVPDETRFVLEEGKGWTPARA